MTRIGEFRPGNKTIYAVFDEESYFLGPRTYVLSLEGVFLGNTHLITIYCLRSNFNSRGVNSREIEICFGHSSEPVKS